MSHRLLFDANLAPRLVALLTADFPDSLHVRDLDLERALDVDVLRAAEDHDLVIVTKDRDFADLVTARGHGPKIVWLQVGNTSTGEIERALVAASASIAELLDDPAVRVVQVGRRSLPSEAQT